jgi:ABC-2 type transport system ATP-binding protein
MRTACVIRCERVSKRFADVVAVRELDLEIQRGEVFGLLGTNGAGKTTTLRLLTGIMRPSSGTIRVLGVDLADDPRRAKSRLGYMAQASGPYGDLTVEENVAFFSSLYGPVDRRQLAGLLDDYGFSKLRKRLARELSGGYRTRLCLLTALSHHPEIVLLDEPTSGVDPVTRKQLWEQFYRLRRQGITLIVTTHYMEEAERCDRLAFLVDGRVAALGSPDEIRRSLGAYEVFDLCGARDDAVDRLAHLPGLHSVNQFADLVRIVCRRGSHTPRSVTEWLSPIAERGGRVRRSTPTLEDAFVVLTDGRMRG